MLSKGTESKNVVIPIFFVKESVHSCSPASLLINKYIPIIIIIKERYLLKPFTDRKEIIKMTTSIGIISATQNSL